MTVFTWHTGGRKQHASKNDRHPCGLIVRSHTVICLLCVTQAQTQRERETDTDTERKRDRNSRHRQKGAMFVGWLLNVQATGECISGTDLHRQFYVLPH